MLRDHVTTGDGLIAALQFLAVMVNTGQPASTLARVFDPVPQKLINLRYPAGTAPLETDRVQEAIAKGEKELGTTGRLLIRTSGTEPQIRLMGEAEDPARLDRILTAIKQECQKLA